MSAQLQAPRGTFDVLPAEASARTELLETIVRPAFSRAGYGRIETPVFEDTALFSRGVGESTEIVSKEMYSLNDQGGRSLTLRPEGTAAVCRAFIEHGMHKLPLPVKLWYAGPFFRQEAPQAARFRQFSQIGAEALGSDDPALDAESIALLAAILAAAGVSSRLRISSLGSQSDRADYLDDLRRHLRANDARLSDDVRQRIDLNPLRAFDAKHQGTRAVMADAPRLLDAVGTEDRAHFNDVLALLDAVGIVYEIDPTLVRGLDYYTRTVFEFTSDDLGAQSGVGGGGRYDGLVELLGGRPAPAIGWAAGIERVLAASARRFDLAGARAADGVYIALDHGADRTRAFALALELRGRGLTAEFELAGRSLKGQLKQAGRIGAGHVVVLGGDRGAYDAGLKNMTTGQQREIVMSEPDFFERIVAEITADRVTINPGEAGS